MLGVNHIVWKWRGGSLDHTAEKEAEKQDVAAVLALDHMAGEKGGS